MSTPSFNGLLIISVIAVIAPILAATVKRLKLPSAVAEIAAGIIAGPSVLGWVKIDEPINVVALLGLAFLLFLAGPEIDLRVTPPSQLRAPVAGFAGSLMLGVAASRTGLGIRHQVTARLWPGRRPRPGMARQRLQPPRRVCWPERHRRPLSGRSSEAGEELS
jgi:Kef-type K+ transport system membrane component KefB